MFRVFEGQTANLVWVQIADAFRKGEGCAQPSRAGGTLEILHSAMSISNPTERWITSRVPAINLAFAIAEVVWILRGRNDSAFLNYFNHQLPKFAGDDATYHGAYGYRIRRSLGLDQLERAYLALRSNASSRQIVLQIWDSRIDLPDRLGKPQSADIPCNIVAILRARNRKLEWMQIMRSNDMYRGLPYNIVQFTMLQEVMAGWLNLGIGEYNQVSNSLHVYERDLKYVEDLQGVPGILNTDSLAFPKDHSDKFFQQLESSVERIISPTVQGTSLVGILRGCGLPTSFRNMLSVLCAEGARRRGELQLANDLISECTNPIYDYLYGRWLMRFRTKEDTQAVGM